MSLITNRRLASLASASAIVATMAVAIGPSAALAATTPIKYFNGFESAANTTEAKAMFEVDRVDERTSPIDAAAGRWYATAARDANVFTRYGGYSSTFPTGGYTTSIDIYLDTADSAGTDLRFDWTSAISSPSGEHRRDFVFTVATDPNAEGTFAVNATNNATGDPVADPAKITISNSGWYTFKHTFRNDHGVLAVDMSVIKANGTVVGNWTRSESTDIIGSTVGGNRYGWLASNDFAELALDNVTRR